MPKSALFAKQSILDANNNLYGFEILYRNSDVNAASFDDGTLATAELLVNYCGGLIDSKFGPYVKIFINLTKELIFSDYFFPLPPQSLVIEIPNDIDIDIDLLVRISELKNNGYSFALNGYTFEPQFDDLLSLVDYIKLDTIALSPEEIGERYEKLKKNVLQDNKRDPIILAEKVETEEVHEICKNLGFYLFQGYFLAQPKIVYGKKLEPKGQNTLRLVAALQQQDITIKAVCELISQDVQLSYLILKIVNSPLCQLMQRIDSLQHGITYLGLKQVKQWSMILALTSNSNAPLEVFRLLLERAKSCELYSVRLGGFDPSISFTVGLFSGLDIVFHADKSWLLQQIGLSKKITDAILGYEGATGKVLEHIVMLEKGQLEELENLNIENKSALIGISLESTKWADELISMI